MAACAVSLSLSPLVSDTLSGLRYRFSLPRVVHTAVVCWGALCVLVLVGGAAGADAADAAGSDAAGGFC